MDSRELREVAQDEIDEVVRETVNVDRIVHFSKEETEERFGLNWTNLSRVYFAGSGTVEGIQELRERLDNLEYLAVITEEEGEACLDVSQTYELSERFKSD